MVMGRPRRNIFTETPSVGQGNGGGGSHPTAQSHRLGGGGSPHSPTPVDFGGGGTSQIGPIGLVWGGGVTPQLGPIDWGRETVGGGVCIHPLPPKKSLTQVVVRTT